MMALLARRRGGSLVRAISYLWAGCQNGDPTAIGISAVLGVVVVAFIGFKIKGMMSNEDTADEDNPE